MSKRENRTVRPTEVRVTDDAGGRTFEAVVVRYGVIDDYGTRFRAGCFTDSLSERLPRICWAHRWDEPLGRYVDYRDTGTELTLIGELDDFDAVPRARQASAQLASGTIDQFSVGFMRLADELVDPDEVGGRRGVYDITEAQLDEVSLVLVGAVPGTELVGVRSTRAAGVAVDDVVELGRRVDRGEISQEEAQAALDLLAGESGEEGGDDPPSGDVAGALAEADAVLEDVAP